METIPELINQVNIARRKVLAATEGLSFEQEHFRLAPGEWSIPQVIEHLVLAEHGGIWGMWTEAEAVRRGQPTWSCELVNQGLPFEEVVARTWRDQEEAPPNATPQIDGPLAYCTASLKACEPILMTFGTALNGLDPTAIIYPHFLSGPLDVNQRLQFLRWHLDHHRLQIEEIKAAI